MAIKTVGLTKRYKVGGSIVKALSNVTLEIPDGEICCIQGPSGSGKSTLLNHLAGLEPPTSGKVYICGQSIIGMSEGQLADVRRKNIGFVFQNYNLLPQYTALENVSLPLMLSGVNKLDRTRRASAELKQMGLQSRQNHLPRQLSGGQQQRVGIARAFITRPQIIFADEPTGNLDSRTKIQVLRFIIENAQRFGTTVVIVTHEAELAQCGNRIITIRDGAVKQNQQRTSAEIKAARSALFSLWEGQKE